MYTVYNIYIHIIYIYIVLYIYCIHMYIYVYICVYIYALKLPQFCIHFSLPCQVVLPRCWHVHGTCLNMFLAETLRLYQSQRRAVDADIEPDGKVTGSLRRGAAV